VAPKDRTFDAPRSLPKRSAAFLAKEPVPSVLNRKDSAMINELRVCDVCGDPAGYRFDYGHGGFDFCEECARDRGAEMNGRAEAAFRAIAHAIESLRETVLTDEQIRQGFEGLLKADLSGWSDDDFLGVCGDVLGHDFREDRRWARMYTPIGEEMAA
jgi:hypothetical protein